MKVKCLNCGTIIDIEESEYPVGIEQTIECPLCQEKVSFTIKDESKTSEVLPPSISAVKGPIKVKSRVAKSDNYNPEESSQNNQNENKEDQQASDDSLDERVAKWEETSQQITNNSNPLYRLAYYLGYYHDNIKKGLICICALIVLFFVGKFFWNNGDKFEGQYKGDLINGKGTYYYLNGDKYVGDWKNDLREGKGIFYWENGNKYEGEYKKDEREGKGILYYKNGNRYEGEFKEGMAQGKGKFFYNNGDRYEGEFKNDKLNGKGIFYFKDGKKEKHVYEDDRLVSRQEI
jgi:hypothetical protein